VAVLLTPADNALIFVNGTDGGLFKAVTGTSGLSDNGYISPTEDYCGTVFIPTGGDGSAGWLRDYSGQVPIEAFGATGSGDDTVAVQLAYAWSIASNGIIYCDSGKTYLTDNYTWSSGTIRLTGEGTIKLNDNTNAHLFAISGTAVLSILGWDSGFTLDGNKANQTWGAGLGPDLLSAQNKFHFDNVNCINGARYGVKTNTGADGATLLNCNSDAIDNVNFFFQNTNKTKVDNLKSTSGGTLLAYRDDSQFNTIDNINATVTVADHFGFVLDANDAGGGIPGPNPRYNVCNNITIDGSSVAGGISLSGPERNVLNNISMANCTVISSLELTFGAQHNHIMNVFCDNCYGMTIVSAGGGAKPTNYNTVVNYNSINTVTGILGVQFQEAYHNIIDGGSVEASTSHGIALANSGNNRIRTKIIGNSGADHGIYLTGASENNDFSDSEVRDFSKAARYMFNMDGTANSLVNIFSWFYWANTDRCYI